MEMTKYTATLPEEAEQREDFIIDNDKKADWAVRKIAELNREYDRLYEIARDELHEIQDRLLEIAKKHDQGVAFFTSKLAAYFDTTPEEDRRATKTQESYQLLSGKLVRKRGGFKTDYADADLVQYLRESNQEDYIHVFETPAWGEFKKQLEITENGAFDKATGEMLEFVHVEKQPDKFEVKVG